ncbi:MULTISPECIES: hypothetical protein [unclassified Breznakia]|uniref:hypothetical protein n=1 Tax=unclassified Breznakia TaxID=2623764 RepID=UPI0024759FED|nr:MULTISPECIES: hypothetical protein [unclassified Breznakia]MDH6367270.1 hypothetical protein [Breznakia sp. PH1-1]MDH6404449.1 hypothetical protein [Breznakia sp. PF1-11]MDH6412160.1 hypothetical protein [Breznakia sp. PFB1-11]MDH6414437.1 hypothetical protein [Breznakia sp. PFB1-14]MDH6416822.1 hypothetical protein [Breznakia sp. PFB1-4]
MKKQISIILVMLMIASGSMFSLNRFNENALANNAIEQKVDMQMEYDKPETIQKQIKEKFAQDNEKVIHIVNESARGTDSKLHDIYRVETISDSNPVIEAENPIAEHIYMVHVQMKDTKAPVIKANDLTLSVGDTFTTDDLEASAYDVVDGDLPIEYVKNDVDSTKAGTYEVIMEATDANHNTSRKSVQVVVNEVEQTTEEQSGYTGYSEPTNTVSTPASPTYTTPALDRNNLYVRGWKIVVGNDVSDGVIRSYMSELQGLPAIFNNSNLHTITIDNSLSYPYLGMAYSDGRLWLNGSAYYATTALHEMTHMYDYANNASGNLEGIFQAEKNNLPAKFSGNMRDNRYEWLANLVVYYYYDQGTLRAAAPQSYNYVRNLLN